MADDLTAAGAAKRIRNLLDQRILVHDGAWGTMLQRAGLTPADYRGDRFNDHPREVTGDPDLLNLTRPDVVRDVHRRYLAAGADITTTNTFTATSIGQAMRSARCSGESRSSSAASFTGSPYSAARCPTRQGPVRSKKVFQFAMP